MLPACGRSVSRRTCGSLIDRRTASRTISPKSWSCSTSCTRWSAQREASSGCASWIRATAARRVQRRTTPAECTPGPSHHERTGTRRPGCRDFPPEPSVGTFTVKSKRARSTGPKKRWTVPECARIRARGIAPMCRSRTPCSSTASSANVTPIIRVPALPIASSKRRSSHRPPICLSDGLGVRWPPAGSRSWPPLGTSGWPPTSGCCVDTSIACLGDTQQLYPIVTPAIRAARTSSRPRATARSRRRGPGRPAGAPAAPGCGRGRRGEPGTRRGRRCRSAPRRAGLCRSRCGRSGTRRRC